MVRATPCLLYTLAHSLTMHLRPVTPDYFAGLPGDPHPPGSAEETHVFRTWSGKDITTKAPQGIKGGQVVEESGDGGKGE